LTVIIIHICDLQQTS